jgi:hypothetical protein
MADHVPALIWIGGPIPNALIPALCRAISAEGVSLDWDEPVQLKNQADLESAINAEGRLQFTAAEAPCGGFENLEAFLERHGISYDRHSSAHSLYDAELIRYRGGPDGGRKLVQLAIECGDPVVRLAAVEQARQLLLRGDVAAALERLERICESVPELEPIRWTDG